MAKKFKMWVSNERKAVKKAVTTAKKIWKKREENFEDAVSSAQKKALEIKKAAEDRLAAAQKRSLEFRLN
jgi:hypothetical protein